LKATKSAVSQQNRVNREQCAMNQRLAVASKFLTRNTRKPKSSKREELDTIRSDSSIGTISLTNIKIVPAKQAEPAESTGRYGSADHSQLVRDSESAQPQLCRDQADRKGNALDES